MRATFSRVRAVLVAGAGSERALALLLARAAIGGSIGWTALACFWATQP